MRKRERDEGVEEEERRREDHKVTQGEEEKLEEASESFISPQFIFLFLL